MSNSEIKKIADSISQDPQFASDVRSSINNILKDGKIDMADVPEMMVIVTKAYNKSKSFTVSIDDLPYLLTEIAHIFIVKYDLVEPQFREQFEKVLQSSITLILLAPEIRHTCGSCLPCIGKN